MIIYEISPSAQSAEGLFGQTETSQKCEVFSLYKVTDILIIEIESSMYEYWTLYYKINNMRS